MNKNGFTLMELLVVISILVITSVSATLVFDTATSSTEKEDTRRLYVNIQKTGEVYLDLNDSWMNSFNEKGEVYLKVSELENANYYNSTYEGIKTNKKISGNYFVKVFTNKKSNLSYVDTCLISYDKSNQPHCIADRNGNSDNCDYNTKCVGA